MMIKKPAYEELENRIKELENISLEAKQSEENLPLVMSEAEKLAGFGAWEWDMVRDKWTVSDNWLKIHGYKDKVLKTEELLTIAHQNDIDRIRKAFNQCVNEGVPYDIEHRIIKQDTKEVRYVRVFGRVENNSNGKPVKLYGAAQDITESKTQEIALQKSEKKYRDLVNTAQEGIWAIDKENRTTFANPSLCKMLGYSIDEMMGKSLFDFMDDQGVELAKTKLTRRRQGEPELHDFVFIHKNGQCIYTTITTAAIMDEEGHYGGAIAGIIDITERKKTEKKNRHQQHLLEVSQQLGHLGTWELDIVKNKLVWTDETCRIFGVLPGSIVDYETFLSKIHPEDVEYVDQQWKAAMQGQPYDIEHRLIKDGVVTSVREKAEISFDEKGEAIYAIGFIQDITGRKKIEETLKISEERFRRIFDELSIGMALCDENGKFLKINQAFTEIIGFSTQEMSQLTFSDITSSEFHDEEMKLFKGLSEGAIESYKFEKQCIHKDGYRFWASVHANKLMSSDGSSHLFIGSIENIDKEKRVSLQLKQSENQLKTTVEKLTEAQTDLQNTYDLSPGLICIANVNTGYFTKCNPAVTTILGYSEEEFTSKPYMDFVHPDDRQITIDTIAKQLVGSSIANFQNRYQCKDGSYKWMSWVATKADKDGNVHGIATDNTQIKESEIISKQLTEDLKQKNTELERLIYTISHDLKTPLVTISGFCGMAQEGLVSGDQEQCKKSLVFISRAAKRMQQLIKELLNISRIGVQINPNETASLNDLFKEALENIAGGISENKTTIDIESSLPDVKVDRLYFLQVIENLLTNASRYSHSATGGSNIKVGVTRNADELICYIKDNGIGIEPQYLEKVFGLFEKLDSKSDSTGVGLAIVKRIIENHGGRIWAESEGLGHGTTFCFTLPEA